MLKTLDIRDFAIIDSLTVDFAPGLNVMTGETGAGKTIIAQAINIVLGARASQDVVRTGSERAAVTAAFDASKIPAAIANQLSVLGIDAGEELIIHRTVGQKSRITINGTPVSAVTLRSVATRLVDVSSQHEHQLLLDRSCHASILDEFGESSALFAEYAKEHGAYAGLKSELEALMRNEEAAKEKLDYLKFQLDEIKTANLKPDEDKEIESERNRLKYSVQLEEKARGAEALLYGNAASAIEQLDMASGFIDECARMDESAAKWSEALSRARSEVEDVARSLSKYADGLGSEPGALENLEERLHLIRRIVKKHGGTVESCMARAAEIEKEVASIVGYDDTLEEKKAQLAEAFVRRKVAAEALSKARVAAAKRLEKAVEKELAELGMKRTKFSSPVKRKDEGAWDETGPDDVEFMIAPNVGEPQMPLARIASGGELSRIMLAVKCVLAENQSVASTSVFDEVDSGIGGGVAEVVGRKLRKVSRARQILCITHLPQVAVWGGNHIRISKEVRDGRTVTALSTLPFAGRVSEIARMLGGTKITETTIEHAREMLESVVRDKG